MASQRFKDGCASIQSSHRSLFGTRKTADMYWRTRQLKSCIKMCEEGRDAIAKALTEDLG